MAEARCKPLDGGTGGGIRGGGVWSERGAFPRGEYHGNDGLSVSGRCGDCGECSSTDAISLAAARAGLGVRSQCDGQPRERCGCEGWRVFAAGSEVEEWRSGDAQVSDGGPNIAL